MSSNQPDPQPQPPFAPPISDASLEQPVSGPSGMTEEEHWRYTLRKLGAGIVDVELNDEHKQDALRDAKRWYSLRVGFRKSYQIQLQCGATEYTMPADVIHILRVWMPSLSLPTLDADAGSTSYFSLLFGAWTNPSHAPMPYSDLVQRLQYLEQIGRIFTTDRDWDWYPETRTLRIMPATSSSGGHALVTAWSRCVDTRELDPEGEDFFRRRLLIEAYRTLANVRTTIQSIATVGGEISLNGDSLDTKADTMEEKLNRDILEWRRELAVPIIIG